MSRQEKELYEFGPFRLDPGQRLLLRDDKPVPLQAKAFDILLVLVRSSEQLVSKDDLMKVVWPDTFVEESNLTQNIFVLRKALGEKAGAFRYIVTVPSRGYRFAEKVRLISQEETLAIESRSRTRVVIQESLPRWRPWALRSGLPLIVVFCAVAVYQSSRIRQAKRSEAVASPRIQTRRSVAVLGFQNLSGRSDPAWLSTALSEMLTTEIGGGDQVRMISAEEVAHLKNSLPLLGGTLSKGTLTQIRRDLGADIVVLGSFSDLGKQSHGQLRLDLQIQDTRAGETVATLSETGTEDELFQLVSRTGAQLREKLSVPAISGYLVARVQAAMPSNTESARLYAEGLEKIRQFDALSGKDFLQRSIAADPSYAPAHSALAEAWSQLGYEGKATAEAHTAFELSDKLAHKDRLYIEATYRRMNREWGKAIGLYQALSDFFPDDVEYGLRLADAQTQSGNGRDVGATIALLRKLPPPANDDVRIDLAEEMNDIRRGEYSTARSVAVAAVEKARANGLDLPLARALYLEAATVAPLGEGDKAIAAAEEAKKIYQRAGDQWGVSNALEYIAYVRATHGEWDEAEKIYRQALAINRSIGSKTGAAIDLTSIAAAHEARGDLQGGRKMDEEALAIYREIGDRTREGWALLGIGRAVAEDDPIEGLKLDEQALAAFKDVGDDNGTADVMYE
jgi:DNA-binding winged helix-turn-helix (wHTH) protein/tetratricopeptide (TPR) repeat protein/TolB-like protein